MCKRALIIFDWMRLSAAHLRALEEISKHTDELILVIDRTSIQLPNAASPSLLSCADLMTSLNSLLSAQLNKPYYLFPIEGNGASDLHHWLRYKILCPSFERAYTDKPEWQIPVQTVLRIPVEIVSIAANEPLIDLVTIANTGKTIKRGAFITRAQPFHLGHAAFIEQMASEQEEVIVVVGVANKSHQPADMATAGERLEMILPWLIQHLPGRYYLAPLPYSDFTLENVYELHHLLPAFSHIYTVNTSIWTMAATAGYQTRAFDRSLDISASLIRECILHDRPYKAYVPPTVYQYLQASDIPQRLKKLHEKEAR